MLEHWTILYLMRVKLSKKSKCKFKALKEWKWQHNIKTVRDIPKMVVRGKFIAISLSNNSSIMHLKEVEKQIKSKLYDERTTFV